jgi:hypothetical protein
MVCETCLVMWDQAEETGKFLLRWVSDFTPEWRGPGAILFAQQPHVLCVKCNRGYERRGYRPVAVVVRP